jgi:hypothetical protein
MLKTLTTAYIIVFCDFITWLNMSARRTQTFVSFKKYMPPPLPYLKVNIYPFPLPHFASICFAYLWSFRWPNYIVTLPRYFSFRLPYLNIHTSDKLNKNSQRTWLIKKFSQWNGYSHFRFALDSEFSRPAIWNSWRLWMCKGHCLYNTTGSYRYLCNRLGWAYVRKIQGYQTCLWVAWRMS